MKKRLISSLCLAVVATLVFATVAEARTQTVNDRRNDNRTCAPHCDIRSVSVTQSGKRVTFVIRFWFKRAARMSHIYSSVTIKAEGRRYSLVAGKIHGPRRQDRRRIRFKRRSGLQVHSLPLSAIGNPASFRWRAAVGCCQIADYVPNRRMKRFRVRRTGPAPLPTWRIFFKGKHGRLPIKCETRKPCRGRLAIKKGSIDLVEPKDYTVPGRRTKNVPIELTAAGQRALRKKRRATGVLTLKNPDGKQVRYRAILRRR